MNRLLPIAVVALTFVVTTPVLAAAAVGEPFLLTDTRYGPASGYPMLLSSGRDVTLFWNSGTRLRATRVGTGLSGPSHTVLKNSGADSYSAAWTGSHFLLVAGQANSTSSADDDRIVGQKIDSTGQPIGAPFVIIARGSQPRIAFDGTTVLMLYLPTDADQIHAIRLSPDGVPLQATSSPTGLSSYIQGLASNGRSFAAIASNRWERQVVLFDRGGAIRSTTPLATDDSGRALIATDGERYLVADGSIGRLSTLLIEADGTAGPEIDLVPRRGGVVHPTAATWSGSRWVVAYVDDPYNADETYAVAQLNGATRAVEAREEVPGPVASMAASGGQLTLAWLPGDEIRLAQSSIAAGPSVTASVAPAAQRLHGTASARHGTLVLWEEGFRLHAGVRGANGQWTENELPVYPAYAAAAASDGEGFAAIAQTMDGHRVLRLDRNGRLLGEPASVDWDPQQILWTGREYVLYRSYHDLTAATLSRSGTLSAPRTVSLAAIGASGVDLASNGDGFYAVWLAAAPFVTPPMPPTGALGIRLRADLTPLDAAPTVFAAQEETYAATATWNGSQYVVAWSGEKGLRVTRVSAHDGTAFAAQTVSTEPSYAVRLQTLDGGDVLLDWQQWSDPLPQVVPHLAFLSPGGFPSTPVALPRPDDRLGSDLQRVAALPGGRATLVEAAVADDAAVDGAVRLRMAVVSRDTLPQRPAAPQLIAPAQGDVIELRWIAPPQAISGYRIEYRSNDGPWIETGPVLPAEQQSASIATQGRKVSFRVRAWNDAGPGAYSDAVVVNGAARRRVVRGR
ncbi:MAG TPA: fibronectin type III domain-containing protein [Thermoanaerobaculia bacterium]|nr:fibronectin type III domain-containing protein [Thermoanaerobaculia bacterium]